MPTMTNTTLTADVDTVSQKIPLTSVANVTAPGRISAQQSMLFVDKEAMLVTAVDQKTATVIRGYAGTKASAHSSGALVWTGPVMAYASQDPSGKVTATPQGYLPLVVIGTGNVWQNDGSGNWQQTNS